MIIVTPEEFNTYTNNYDDTILKTTYVETAQEIVESYVGYELTAKDYSETLKGASIILGAMPVNSVTSLTVDGVAIDSADYSIVNNEIVLDDASKITKRSVTKVEYNAGYNSIDDVPSVFKVAVLKISSLLMMEEGGNIGVTGVSTPDGLGRTFLNYNNYNKHLQIVKPYRIIRFGDV